jgi:hypothetical protein
MKKILKYLAKNETFLQKEMNLKKVALLSIVDHPRIQSTIFARQISLSGANCCTYKVYLS